MRRKERAPKWRCEELRGKPRRRSYIRGENKFLLRAKIGEWTPAYRDREKSARIFIEKKREIRECSQGVKRSGTFSAGRGEVE